MKTFAWRRAGVALAFLAVTVMAYPASAAAPIPPNGHVVQTGDIMTYYEEYGSGPPLLLLHGSLSSSSAFGQVIPALSKDYRVIAADSRGRGRSTDTSKPLTYHQMMSDTVALLDALGVTKTHILGWSDGAVIGIDMAIYHPERVASLVSYGGRYNANAGTSAMNDMVRSMTIESTQDWVDAYRAVSSQPERAELMLEKVRSMVIYLPNYSKQQLKSVQVPVLVLAGAKDELVQQANFRELSKMIPGAKLVIMPDTGHFAPFEKPAEFTKIVLDYLKTQTIQ